MRDRRSAPQQASQLVPKSFPYERPTATCCRALSCLARRHVAWRLAASDAASAIHPPLDALASRCSNPGNTSFLRIRAGKSRFIYEKTALARQISLPPVTLRHNLPTYPLHCHIGRGGHGHRGACRRCPRVTAPLTGRMRMMRTRSQRFFTLAMMLTFLEVLSLLRVFPPKL